jgi:hypothetical protein
VIISVRNAVSAFTKEIIKNYKTMPTDKLFKGTRPQGDGEIVMVAHDKKGNRLELKNSIRDSGYYWVKVNENDDWEIASWDGCQACWFYNGERSDCDISIKFIEINETRIKNPDELT